MPGGGGPPVPLRSCCLPQPRHSRYRLPSGPRRRCQRWSPSRHRQGLAIVASLAMSRTGSMRATVGRCERALRSVLVAYLDPGLIAATSRGRGRGAGAKQLRWTTPDRHGPPPAPASSEFELRRDGGRPPPRREGRIRDAPEAEDLLGEQELTRLG